jgi:hypothetical protein
MPVGGNRIFFYEYTIKPHQMQAGFLENIELWRFLLYIVLDSKSEKNLAKIEDKGLKEIIL